MAPDRKVLPLQREDGVFVYVEPVFERAVRDQPAFFNRILRSVKQPV